MTGVMGLSLRPVSKPRVRTMVMNLWLGGFYGSLSGLSPGISDKTFRLYKKFSELNVPGAARIFVFLDEREDAINWGNFYTDMTGYPTGANPAGNPASYMMADIPGAYHNNACGFSFGDGHSEIKKWRDSRTYPPLKKGAVIFNGSTPDKQPRNPDIGWLQDRTTRPYK